MRIEVQIVTDEADEPHLTLFIDVDDDTDEEAIEEEVAEAVNEHVRWRWAKAEEAQP